MSTQIVLDRDPGHDDATRFCDMTVAAIAALCPQGAA
jgi:inosine-uridine nucleoside N-ribohydrolase